MKKQYILECDHCSKTFETNKNGYYHARHARKTKNHKCFCSTSCRILSRGFSPIRKVGCVQCNKQFEKRFCEIKRTKNNFCSQSCAGQYNNKNLPKRKAKLRKCRACDVMIGGEEYGQRVHCFECIKNKKHYKGRPTEMQTIEELTKRDGQQSNRYSQIRYHGRNLYKKELSSLCCEKCGYDKHVELCHKQAISEFDKNTLVLEVNRRDNIMFLCPNCHWEYDHNL